MVLPAPLALTASALPFTLGALGQEALLPMIDIDPRGVLETLGFQGYSGLEPMSGGWANAMWRFQTPDGTPHVLRVYPHPEWAPAARRERAALEAARAGGIPVPAVEAAGTWHDLVALVISWCPGTSLLAALERRPWRVWLLGHECGRLQARIHSIQAPPELRDAISGWLASARAAGPDVDALAARVDLAANALLHLDYHPVNILTDGERITAVVDWTNAAAGDPRADVARTVSLISAGPVPPHPLRPLLSMARGLLVRGWLRGYQAEAGALGDLAPFLSLAGLSVLADIEEAVREGRGWGRERDLEVIRRWTARWKAKAGREPPAAARVG
ncbi:MAG TPA: aminoglycoside phosphotransferase family protein [Dehalococcoidia bacterium]|nr:aminoglycoside phosphotransferase family protein [Dehalococcoidia bacterium]